ncbi:MAG TPA: DUF5336 domain-containing protein [Pseudonocardia sp.]|nr:DUF5336 domain-containing protein [Pseudonocardia sp.]
MTRNAETPPETPPETSPASGVEESSPASAASTAAGSRAGQSGPVAELGLVAAGLGLVIYLIGFVTNLGGSSSLILPLLLGGGLLAGTVALPTVGGRVLAPAAVATTTGALLLLRAVIDDGGSALSVGALVLGLLEAAATVGATLMHSGVVRARPPKARKAVPQPAFSGYPAGPQFPGQQYPGQPHPGAYPADAQPFPGDQWAGEHAFAQNARYGGQYGVPGYPPPPPVGAPGYDPLHARSEAPTVAVGAETPGDTAAPPRATRPVTEPVGSTAEPGSGYGQGAGGFPGLGTGAHRAVPDPGAALFRSDAGPTGTGTHRAVPDPGTGSFRPLSGTGSYPAVPEGPTSGTGSHRAASGTGSFGALSSGRWPEADPAAPADPDGERTRTIPTVPDDKR